MNVAAYIAAAVLFVLAAIAAPLAGLDALELVSIGLGLFALGHVLPR